MKKKILSLAAILLLTGCQDENNQFITYTMPPTVEETETVVETVRPSVIVYGMESVTNGFIIHVDERDKWLVTIASAVSHHPNALIETAEGQLLRATVEAIDAEYNIAILKFRNSAVIEPFTLTEESTSELREVGVATLTEEKQLTSLTSVVMQEQVEVPILVEPPVIQSLLATAFEQPLKWQERAKKSQSLQQLSAIGKDKVNKIETYEKDVFLYNPDELMLNVLAFHEKLTAYMKTKDRVLLEPFVYSDDLIRKLEQVESAMELTPINLKSVALQDTVYEVSGEMEQVTGESKKVLQLTYQLIRHDGEWFVISLKFT